MAKQEVLGGQYLVETRKQRPKTSEKLQLQVVREHPIEAVSLAPLGSPKEAAVSKAPRAQEIAESTVLEELNDKLIDSEDAP